ncbi:MAG TPA: hypothetical protein VM099_12290 [Gemmatimonadaceae bacterium]|nr:hypothetical protein [Gemmatimonadaceae bacterium]
MTTLLGRMKSVSLLILFGAFATVVVNHPLRAQTSTNPKWETDWSAAVGADPFYIGKAGGDIVANNFSALLAREWSQRGSGLSWRVQLGISRHPFEPVSLLREGQVIPPTLYKKQSLAELGVSARYTFLKSHNVRPYLTAGPSLFAERTAYSINGAVFGGTNSGTEASSTVWSVGGTAGVGLAFRLFRLDMFVEQRFLLPELSTRGTNIAHPFTLGVRF